MNCRLTRKSRAVYRVLLLVTAIILMLVLSASQPTPEEPVVVGKDQEEMIEAAVQTPPPGQKEEQESRALAERLGVPERYAAEITQDKLIINADAQVVFPDTDKVPMYRVTAADFTQKQTDGFIKALFGDEPLYEYQAGMKVMTKAEIEEMLVIWKQRKVSTKGEFSTEEGQEWCDDVIESFEKQYQTAPEENNVIASDGKLKLMDLNNRDTGEKEACYYWIYVFTADSDVGDANFSIENNNDLEKAIQYEDGSGRSVKRNARLSYDIRNDDTVNDNYWQSTPIPVDKDTVITDEVVLEKLTTTPGQAQKMAENMLAAAGVDNMELFSMSLVDNENMGNVDGVVSPAALYAYRLQFARVVDGMRCSYITGTTSVSDNAGFAALWDYETFEIYIDDRGIFSLRWMSPIEIQDNITTDASMLPFEDIADKFEDMMRIRYLPESKAPGRVSTTIDIQRVSLELFRITEQNSIENGLLVPVWNFYGTKTADYEDGGNYSEGEGVPVSLLVVNAVDGSIIDPEQGY